MTNPAPSAPRAESVAALEKENALLRQAVSGYVLAIEAVKQVNQTLWSMIYAMSQAFTPADMVRAKAAFDEANKLATIAAGLTLPYSDHLAEKQLGAAFNPASKIKQ